MVAKVEWHIGELYPRVGFIVTNLSRPAERGFLDLDDAREIIEAWRIDYNTSRPHSALGYATPEAHAE